MSLVSPLSWGRRYLMCRPEHFRVDYAINPWMDVNARVDIDLVVRLRNNKVFLVDAEACCPSLARVC